MYINYVVRGQNQVKSCDVCKKEESLETKIKTCSQCKMARYCSTNCQGIAWPQHKKVCSKNVTLIIPETSTVNQKYVTKAVNNSGVLLSSLSSKAPIITNDQIEFAKKLININPLESILDNGVNEALCKKIGQEIFDKYKIMGNDFEKGRQAVKDVCNWIAFNCKDGPQRKEFIEYAWDGIGDENWRWQH